MPMEPGGLLCNLEENQWGHHQYQGIMPEIPGRPQQASHTFSSQHTIMPSHSSLGTDTGQLPLLQETLGSHPWNPMQNSPISRSEQRAKSLCKTEIPQHPSLGLGYKFRQPSQHAADSVLRLETNVSASHDQPNQERLSNEEIFIGGQSGLPIEYDLHLPFNRNLNAVYPSQSLRPVSKNCMFRAQTGQNCSSVVAGCTEGNPHAMGTSMEQHHAGACSLDLYEATQSLPIAPGISQGLSFGPVANSHGSSFIRKLRHRERNTAGYRKFREQLHVHGKRNQPSEEESCNLPPHKQFISEERMAARMSNLSIANDNKMATLQERWLQAKTQAERQLQEIESRLSDSESDVECDSDIKNAGDDWNQLKQIQVSPELKTALSQQEGLLPDSVVKSLSSPCTQIVLWRPPLSIGDVTNTLSKRDWVSQGKPEVQSSDSVNASGSCTGDTTDDIRVKDAPAQIARPICWNSVHTSGSTSASELFDCVDDDMEL